MRYAIQNGTDVVATTFELDIAQATVRGYNLTTGVRLRIFDTRTMDFVENTAMSPAAIALLERGQKIQAIKTVREETALGLGEAKKIVDDYERDNWLASSLGRW